MQRKDKIIKYLENQMSEVAQDIEVLENEIKALEEKIEIQENLKYALESAWVGIKTFQDNLE